MLEHILKNTDWEVVGVASWEHKGTPERIEEVLEGHPEFRERLTIITHDLNALFPERTKARIGKVDYILNIASDSHVDRSITDPVPFVKNNVNIALTMLELAREVEPKAFLQFSTDEVYGAAPDGVNHKEWASMLPSNPYSASKVCQEAIAISYWRTYGVPLIITNTMNLIGPFQDPEKYTAQLIRKISRGEEVTVHGADGRIGSRYYLHARNAADAILHILKNVTPVKYKEDVVDRPDRFNIVGEVELDNLALAEKVATILEKPLRYRLVDFHSITTRPGHDRRYALDGEKLREFGWSVPVDFDQSLESYIKWTLNHPVWL
jgi:dTDP-glucose 4,6-dehydratase